MATRMLLLAVSMVSVALAGCASDSGDGGVGPGPVVDKDDFELKAGTGAIAGLLVDDRFRPIQLTDDPQTEFQAAGFILLQETGEKVQTTENGEFTFVDLEPGTYTLRASITDHEASPQRVTVQEGIFNEINVLARRILSEAGSIVSQEYAMFTFCSVEFLVGSHAAICGISDLSGDSSRVDIQTDYSSLAGSATVMTTEFLFNQDVQADVAVRLLGAGGGLDATYFGEQSLVNERYTKMTLYPGLVSEDGKRNVPFSLNETFQTIIFPYSITHEYGQAIYDAGEPALGLILVGLNGVGIAVGIEAKLIQSVFIGEPEVDVEAYCLLCGAA